MFPSWFRKCGVLSLLMMAGGLADAQTPAPPVAHPLSQVRGPHFGLPLPGEKPERFAPEILAAFHPFVEATAFSPDGLTFFASVGTADYSGAKLYAAQCVDGVWTPFTEPSFTQGFAASNEVVYSEDGSRLMFTGKKATGEMDLWTVNRAGNGWGLPEPLLAPIRSEASEYRGSMTADGTFYFGSTRTGMMQVYKATKASDSAWKVEMLPAPINKESYEGDPCVAPDGRFLVFYSARNGTNTNLYVSFREANGAWGKPINLGPDFNSGLDEYGAHLSSDGKILFFTRHSRARNEIWWVSVSAIDKLNPQAAPSK